MMLYSVIGSCHTTTYTATMGIAMYGLLQGWYFEQKHVCVIVCVCMCVCVYCIAMPICASVHKCLLLFVCVLTHACVCAYVTGSVKTIHSSHNH